MKFAESCIPFMKNSSSSKTTAVQEPRLGARQRLIDTAIAMFSEFGYRATGIDSLLATANVAKMTMYSHFKSKDDLIVAVIDELSAQLLAGFEGVTAASGESVELKVAAIFDVVSMKVVSEDFHGCEFIRALCEFPDPSSPVHQAVIAHRNRLAESLANLIFPVVSDPRRVGEDIALLIDGALVSGHASGSCSGVNAAKGIALSLLSKG